MGSHENLTEEELSIFDILTRPNMKLKRKEKEQVKQVAKELLDTLKAERLVFGLAQEATSDVRRFNRQLSRCWISYLKHYAPKVYKEKCALVYQHVYDSYYGAGKSIYAY